MNIHNKRRTFFSGITTVIDEHELQSPGLFTIFKLIWLALRGFFHERPGQIIGSSLILIMLWGMHGQLELLGLIWPKWRGPGIDLGKRPGLLGGIPWDHELISFWVGAFLLVGIPILIIIFGFREPLSRYGLGLPPKGKRKLAWWTFLTFTLCSLPAYWLGAGDAEMGRIYPLYRPFSGAMQFILYELTYFPFFVAIEFIFRGYLLFGLAGVRDGETGKNDSGIPGTIYFGKYALLIQMLSYTAWHLGKPLPELFGTLIWGLAAGVMAMAVNSIWPIVLSHWILNVFMDAIIIQPF